MTGRTEHVLNSTTFYEGTKLSRREGGGVVGGDYERQAVGGECLTWSVDRYGRGSGAGEVHADPSGVAVDDDQQPVTSFFWSGVI